MVMISTMVIDKVSHCLWTRLPQAHHMASNLAFHQLCSCCHLFYVALYCHAHNECFCTGYAANAADLSTVHTQQQKLSQQPVESTSEPMSQVEHQIPEDQRYSEADWAAYWQYYGEPQRIFAYAQLVLFTAMTLLRDGFECCKQ